MPQDAKACSKPMLAGMRKKEVLEELEEYGVEYQESWSLVELKEVLKETRAKDPSIPKKDVRLKGMTSKTLAQLRAQCEELGLEYDPKDTRGKLMLTIRRHCDAMLDAPLSGSEVLTVGRYKGEEFLNVLQIDLEYCQWVQTEIPRMFAEDEHSTSQSLVRFAWWLSGQDFEQYRKKAAAAKKPAAPKAPAAPVVSASSAASASAPSASKGKGASSKRQPTGPAGQEEARMEAEVGAEGTAEMTALKSRLAELEGHHQVNGKGDQ